MAKRLNPTALGLSGAIVAALVMLVFGIPGNLDIYTDGVDAMIKWHLFFDLTAFGIVAGMIEAAIASFVLLYALGLVYNRLDKGE